LSDLVYEIKNTEASADFAQEYLAKAQHFYKLIDALRTNALKDES
jgi:hypothetical protein